MKRAARAVADLIAGLAATVGIEGALLLVGTALLAVGAAYLSPAGPWLVTGGVAALTGYALARAPRRD